MENLYLVGKWSFLVGCILTNLYKYHIECNQQPYNAIGNKREWKSNGIRYRNFIFLFWFDLVAFESIMMMMLIYMFLQRWIECTNELHSFGKRFLFDFEIKSILMLYSLCSRSVRFIYLSARCIWKKQKQSQRHHVE